MCSLDTPKNFIIFIIIMASHLLISWLMTSRLLNSLLQTSHPDINNWHQIAFTKCSDMTSIDFYRVSILCHHIERLFRCWNLFNFCSTPLQTRFFLLISLHFNIKPSTFLKLGLLHNMHVNQLMFILVHHSSLRTNVFLTQSMP